MILITYEELQNFLIQNELKYLPSQNEVSFPKIQRIHRRLQQGHSFSPIQVSEGVISDGHHRYICLSLLELDIEIKKAGKNTTYTTDYIWENMNLDTEDHDTSEERNAYAEKYD